MSLLSHRSHYKPFEYPWAFDYWKEQQQIHWLPYEIPMAQDISDWKFKLSEEEKNLVTQILRFFTQGDLDISEGYVGEFLPTFGGQPELRMMLSAFSDMETIHVAAYSHLIDTLGLPEAEYEAFRGYSEMVDKHNYLFQKKPFSGTEHEIARKLAMFSAFGEGLQLFSSFVILMNFQRFGTLKGLGQIVTWSVRDESLHCEGMIKLFNTFIDEHPHLWQDILKADIYQTCRDMVELEDNFIDLAFSMGDIEGLSKDDVKQYVRYLADRRLIQLRLKPNYGVKTNPLKWFDEVLLGNEHGNFFETKVTEYSKGVDRGEWDESCF
jgi:ribonucleoside-diphosphate reductase beta chain